MYVCKGTESVSRGGGRGAAGGAGRGVLRRPAVFYPMTQKRSKIIENVGSRKQPYCMKKRENLQESNKKYTNCNV